MKVSFLDIETTGKLTPGHKIIELSIRFCDLTSYREIHNYLWRFNPDRNIDAKAFAVHGIARADLEHEPKFVDVIPEINKVLLASDLSVAHNGDYFDFPFLQMEYENAGHKMPAIKTFDTMIEGNFATELGKRPSLSELCWSLDIVYDPKLAHRGDYDTEVMRDAFFTGHKLGWFKI